MVLNFFQLKNFTEYSFDIVNSENSSDNYTVGPNCKTARHDAWLAQGNGSKGVTVQVTTEGLVLNLLYMWDHDWAIRFKIGGEERSIPVDSNKDFWIEVDNTNLVFKCYNGTFTGTQESLTVKNWPGLITTRPLKEVRDEALIEYAKEFAPSREKRSPRIEEANKKLMRIIDKLVEEFEEDYVCEGKSKQLVTGEGICAGWRIDIQGGGAVTRPIPNGGGDMRFHVIAIQRGSGTDNVYAQVMLPVGYNVGRQRIRDALLESQRRRAVTWIFPPPGAVLPPCNNSKAWTLAIQALAWYIFVIGILFSTTDHKEL